MYTNEKWAEQHQFVFIYIEPNGKYWCANWWSVHAHTNSSSVFPLSCRTMFRHQNTQQQQRRLIHESWNGCLSRNLSAKHVYENYSTLDVRETAVGTLQAQANIFARLAYLLSWVFTNIFCFVLCFFFFLSKNYATPQQLPNEHTSAIRTWIFLTSLLII